MPARQLRLVIQSCRIFACFTNFLFWFCKLGIEIVGIITWLTGCFFYVPKLPDGREDAYVKEELNLEFVEDRRWTTTSVWELRLSILLGSGTLVCRGGFFSHLQSHHLRAWPTPSPHQAWALLPFVGDFCTYVEECRLHHAQKDDLYLAQIRMFRSPGVRTWRCATIGCVRKARAEDLGKL